MIIDFLQERAEGMSGGAGGGGVIPFGTFTTLQTLIKRLLHPLEETYARAFMVINDNLKIKPFFSLCL